jgi:3-hydroxyacyl-CoA dehydrogenase
MTIQKVAVIGAGVMGAGIAAQIANGGTDVLLLDIVPKGETKNKNMIAEGAIEKLKKAKPAAFMHPKNAKHVTAGNIETDLKLLKDCDWIVEVVIERLDIKQDLYKKIDKHRKKGSIVSSNTSTLPLKTLIKGMPEAFAKDFMITHFFNPPRYMRLLEIVTGSKTSKKSIEKIREFADIKLGKSLVDCHDTPGFIANRIGTFWIHAAVTKAISQDIDVESADSVLSHPAGVPKTGVFGLLDLVGLDLMPHILSSLSGALSQDDAFHKLGEAPKMLEKMIEDGYIGRKGKGGFYRLNEDRKKEVRCLKTGKYYLAKRPKVPAAKVSKRGGLQALFAHDSKEAAYAWDVLSHTLCYAASLVPEIAGNIELVDRAMRLGYNWKYGPFELIDRIGANHFARLLRKEGRKVPQLVEMVEGRKFYRITYGVKEYLTLDGNYVPVPREDGVLLLSDIKLKSKPIFSNISCSLWDIGDNIACLEFHSKMNSLDPFIIAMINKAVKQLPLKGYQGLVIHNEGTNFSVGANIAMLLVTSKLRLWFLIRWILQTGQNTFNKMKYAPFPVVGAPSGMALGGGCEVLLHCNAIEAHAESYVGLVEAGVGIIPGWGGCKEMLGRAIADKHTKKGPMPAVVRAFEPIAMGKVATSAAEAKADLFFKEDDGIVMNKDRVLFRAKQRVLKMAENYTPPEPYAYNLPGKSGLAALKLGIHDFVKKGIASPHDATIATKLAETLTGGNVDIQDTLTEKDILKLERDSIIYLAKTEKTRARIMHILKTGKPLRN